MSLTKLATVTFVPGTPAVTERPYSRYCPPPPPPAAPSGPHGAVVSTYTTTVARQDCYSCPVYSVVEICTVYADGYTECRLQDAPSGGTQTG